MEWTSEHRWRIHRQLEHARRGFYFVASQEWYDAIARASKASFEEAGLEWPGPVMLFGHPVETHEDADFPELQWRPVNTAKCPRCGSPDPKLHPAVQFEGEVQECPHPWHEGGGDNG